MQELNHHATIPLPPVNHPMFHSDREFARSSHGAVVSLYGNHKIKGLENINLKLLLQRVGKTNT